MPVTYRLAWLPKMEEVELMEPAQLPVQQPPVQQTPQQPVQQLRLHTVDLMKSKVAKAESLDTEPTTKPFDCWRCLCGLPLLLALIPVVILAAMLIRLSTRGPRLVTTYAPDGVTTDLKITHDSMVVPAKIRARIAIEPKLVRPCNNTYASPGLPPELKPGEYSVKFTLKGAASGMKITGRVDIPLTPKADVERIVLRADPDTLSAFKMSLIEEPAASGTRKRALDVLSATPILGTNFLVVCLRENMIGGKRYTLVVEYEYHRPTSGTAPILISKDVVRMDLQPLRAHAAFPCFEEDGWKARLRLTVLAPAGFTVVSNTPRKGRPVAVGALMSHAFKTTIAMPLDKLAWVASQRNIRRHTIVPNATRPDPTSAAIATEPNGPE